MLFRRLSEKNMMNSKTLYYDSKQFPVLGRVYVAATEKGVCALSFPTHSVESFFQKILTHFQPNFFTQNPDPFEDLYRQLDQYLTGRNVAFDVSLDLRGTPFQLQVWETLTKIPYGETRSYGEIARTIGRPKACRAVGLANHKNPVPIVVPCHRVIGARGDLVGFGGGLPLKKRLLALEKNP
jgi:epoxyqueuosine reductase